MNSEKIEIQSNPTLDALIDFEKRSWPEEEQANIETLSKRLSDFPEGFTVAMVDNKIVGQTFWKPVEMPAVIEGFDAMSELPTNKNSKTLWGVNIAIDPEFTGKGIAKQIIAKTISNAKFFGATTMKGGIRLAQMKEMIETGAIKSPADYPISQDKLAKAFLAATKQEGASISFSEPQKYWEIDEESMGYASIITIEIKEEINMLDRCVSETVNFGEENIQYFAIGPHRGCPLGCKFCGVKASRTAEEKLSALGYLGDNKMTRKYGEVIFDEFRNLVDAKASDILFLNGGNILREEEMYLPAITQWIPKSIAESKTLESMTIEVRADDIVAKINTLVKIKKSLGSKDLVVRLPIEYADEKMLANSGKGISLETINAAIKTLFNNNITWDAYAMLGGMNLNPKSAAELAERTVRFAFEKGARNVIINSQFITKDMQSVKGDIFVPSFGNIISTLEKLRDVPGKIKVGFDADELLNPIVMPNGTNEERELLNRFNTAQKI